MNRGLRWLVAGVLISCAGCVRHELLVTVNPDGSAVCVLRELVSANGLAWLKSMARQNAGDKEAKDAGETLDPVAEMRRRHDAMVQKMGDGATIAEQDEVNKSGWTGIQTIYTLKDVSQLGAVPVNAATEKAVGEAMGPSFAFKRGSTSELTVVLRKPAASDKEKEKASDDPFEQAGVKLEPAPAAIPQFNDALALGILRHSLQGAGLTVLIQVNGEIVETNAQHKTDTGAIILADLDLGKLVAAPEFEKAVRERQSGENLLSDKMPGWRGAEFDKPLRIRFKATESNRR